MNEYPKVGEVFELTIDGVVRKFKFGLVDRCDNWDELVGELKREGKIPEAKCLNAFKLVYPDHDGGGPIGLADNSDFPLMFPCIHSSFGRCFHEIMFNLRADTYRWLLKVVE